MKLLLAITLALILNSCGTTDETNSSTSRIVGKVTDERLAAITFGNGRFVAAGTNGKIITSTNGTDWQEVAGGGKKLSSVTWGKNLFVAVGDSGAVATSNDGIRWTSHALATGAWCFTSVIFGNNQFVAAGTTNEQQPGGSKNATVIVTSADGINWKEQLADRHVPIHALAYGDSSFVGVGGSRALVSTDGIQWTPFTVEPDSAAAFIHLDAVIRGGDQFVAVGMNSLLYTSPDGKSWTKRDTRMSFVDFTGAVWQDNHYTVIGRKNNCPYPDSVKIATSTDGVSWSSFSGWTAPSAAASVTALAYGAGVYVAIGGNGLVFTSSGGITWNNRSSVTAEVFRDICWSAGQFVAVGTSGTIITSMNGIQWQQRSSVTDADLSAITYGNGCFVAIGAGGTLCASANGADWSLVSSPTPNDLSAIAWGNGSFVAVGKKRVITASVDGKKWEITMPADDTMSNAVDSRVAYGNYGFVMVDSRGEMFTSADGRAWKTGNSAANVQYGEVAWGAGVYVVVGHAGSEGAFFITSADARSWSGRVAVTQSPDLSPIKILRGADQFVVLDGNLPARSVYSADGLAWSLIPDPCAILGFNALAYDGTQYVFVGSGGVIATAPPF